MQRLPSTSALQMFVAAARSESFVRAAESLHVTPAAVSKQVQQLEQLLGASLFERLHKRIRLNARGAAYLTIAESVLSELTESVGGAAHSIAERELIIEVDPELLLFWLLPRMDDLLKSTSGLPLRFKPAPVKAQKPGFEVDLALIYGRPLQPGLIVKRLMSFIVFPVCSPSYVARTSAPISTETISCSTLLHDFDRSWWNEMLDVAGPQRCSGSVHELVLGHPIYSLHAAERGLGLALGDDIMCRDMIEHGTLVRPIQLSAPSREEYYIVTHSQKPPDDRSEPLVRWLLEQAKDQRRWRQKFLQAEIS